MALVGIVLAIRARTWHERVAALALGAINLLFFGGWVVLWPCGENDCGPIMPIYWSLLGAAAIALVVALWGGRRARKH